MIRSFKNFVRDRRGAVTVDWVALTAAIVVIGIGLAYGVYGSGTDGVAGLVENFAGSSGELSQAGSNIVGAVATSLPTT